jgi:hypothetical protein
MRQKFFLFSETNDAEIFASVSALISAPYEQEDITIVEFFCTFDVGTKARSRVDPFEDQISLFFKVKLRKRGKTVSTFLQPLLIPFLLSIVKIILRAFIKLIGRKVNFKSFTRKKYFQHLRLQNWPSGVV